MMSDFLKKNENPRRSHQEHVNKHVTARYISISTHTETQSAKHLQWSETIPQKKALLWMTDSSSDVLNC
jgi:hypothetical protein